MHTTDQSQSIPTQIRLSVSEASRLFGVTTKTIRRALAEGVITYIVVRGRYKISFESLVRWSQERPKIKNKLAQTGIGQYVGQWKIRNRLYSPNPNAKGNSNNVPPNPDRAS
jgi:excisionase family DNA binding protein